MKEEDPINEQGLRELFPEKFQRVLQKGTGEQAKKRIELTLSGKMCVGDSAMEQMDKDLQIFIDQRKIDHQKKLTEEEKLRAESERLRAEEERRRAEKEKKRADKLKNKVNKVEPLIRKGKKNKRKPTKQRMLFDKTVEEFRLRGKKPSQIVLWFEDEGSKRGIEIAESTIYKYLKK